MEILKNNKNKNLNKKGQSIVEYVILFSVVVAVVVVAASTFIGPSLQGLYERTSEVINDINPVLNIN